MASALARSSPAAIDQLEIFWSRAMQPTLPRGCSRPGSRGQFWPAIAPHGPRLTPSTSVLRSRSLPRASRHLLLRARCWAHAKQWHDRRVRLPLVGRETTSEQLQLVARRAVKERRPSLVSVIAPAGTGKTRLVEEFLDWLPSVAPNAVVATAQCLPYGQQLTYWPMRQVLFTLTECSEDAAPARVVRRSSPGCAVRGRERRTRRQLAGGHDRRGRG